MYNGILHIAVCDDSNTDLEYISGKAADILTGMGTDHRISAYTCSTELLQDIRAGAEFGIYLLDVMMNGETGISLAAELRKMQIKSQIIFISSNREMAMYGYEVSAARYLAKPLDTDKLKEALEYCLSACGSKKDILFPTDSGIRKVACSDIRYIEALCRGTSVHLDEEIFEANLKFSQAEAMLPAGTFVLCHRCYAVNLDAVQLIRPYEFVLKSGARIPVSKGRYHDVKTAFTSHITD